MAGSLEIWDLWYPGPGVSGLLFCRSRINGDDVRGELLVHAAPVELNVTVRDMAGAVLAQGTGLKRGQPGPMTYLVREGAEIALRDGWPTGADVGRVVLLPGGEAGILKSWWHANDFMEWRWQVEFYNHR